MPIDAQLLRAISPLLGSLDHDDLSALIAAGRRVGRPRGRILLATAEDAIVVLLNGVATTRCISDSGSEYLRDLHGTGDTLGLTTVLGYPEEATEAVAHDDVDALRVPGPALRRLLHDRPGIAWALLRTLADQLDHCRREQSRFADTATSQRVVRRVLDLAERWGRWDQRGLHLDVRLTQEELASWARSSRESTAKVLHQLRESRIIWTGRRELLVLDLPALQQRAAGPPRTVSVPELQKSTA